MSKALLSGCQKIFFFLFFSLLSSVCFAETSLESSLNLVLRTADNNAGGGVTRDDCLSLQRLSKQQGRFQILSERILSQRCAPISENGQKQNDTSQKVTDLPWDGKPFCKKDSSRMLECDFNSATGRGLLVLGSSDSPENSPSLICAHFAATSRSPLEYLREINARCIRAEYDWRYENTRSDIRGMLAWVNSPVGHAPITIPASLIDQCQTTFSDAFYCTPTLIVLPELKPSSLTTCALQTMDYALGLGPILRVSSLNSAWKCESKSLLTTDVDQRLSVEERSCVPDDLGRLMNHYCRLPYMPITREPWRTYVP